MKCTASYFLFCKIINRCFVWTVNPLVVILFLTFAISDFYKTQIKVVEVELLQRTEFTNFNFILRDFNPNFCNC